MLESNRQIDCDNNSANQTINYYELFPQYREVYISIYIPLLMPAIVGNLGVVCLFSSFRDVRTTTNTIITSMAASDLVFSMGFIVWMSKLFAPLPILQSKTYCMLNFSFAFPMEHVSMWHIFLIALSRMVSLAWPFKHEGYFSKWRVAGILLVIWIVCTVIGSLPLFGWNVWQDGKSSCFTQIQSGLYLKMNSLLRFAALNLCIVSYMALLGTSVKVTNRIRQDEQRMGRIVADNLEEARPNRNAGLNGQRLQSKITRFILTINGVFLLCHLPKAILLFVIGVSPTFKAHEVLYGLNIGGLLNAAINPVFYCFQDPIFKSAIKRILHKI